MKRKLVCFLLAAILGTLSAVAETKAENIAVSMEEITVTANKMEENIQKVPQAISVISEMEIEEKGFKNAMDLINEIPNMIATPDHGIGVTFRGLKRSMFTQNNPVVMYVDGVPIANSFGFDFSLVNIERVEVLRGPQGTLYGKDAIGAVINVITKEPGNEWQGKIGTEYSSWDTWHTKAYINGPLMNDNLFFGVSGQYKNSDGWIKNEYPGMNEDVGRNDKHDLNGYLLFTPTDRLSVRFSFGNYKQTLHALNEKNMPFDWTGSGTGYTNLNDFDREMLKHLCFDVEGAEETKMDSQSMKIGYDFDWFKLESITTHRVRDLDMAYDADYAAGTLLDGLIMFSDSELKTWTQELRLSSSNTSGFRWVGGLYIDQDEIDQVVGMQMPGAWMSSPVNMEQQSVSDEEGKTQAVFAQVMIPIGQNFELTLGGRYQRIKKEIFQKMYFLPVTGPHYGDVTGMSPLVPALELDKTWNVFLPKAALAWFINDKYTAYASFSQGYMPGGFNYFSMGGGEKENMFEPQKSTNYEIGLKAEHDVWRLNLAAFYMEISDIHIYKSIGQTFLTDNADKAHSLGLEVEGVWKPFPTLELGGAMTVMQAEYDDYDIGSKKLDGKHMEGSPSHSLLLSASYHNPNGFYGRADVRHIGNIYYYDDSIKDMQKADSYTLGNIRLGWLYGNWDIYAFAHNLTDEKYINAFKSNAMIGGIAAFGDPRSFGLGVSYTF